MITPIVLVVHVSTQFIPVKVFILVLNMCICCTRIDYWIPDQEWEKTETINCWSCPDIIKLPTLPAGLINLYCGQTFIYRLPALPSGLRELCCWDTEITKLPLLPSTLTDLVCHNTKINRLPTLPNSLSRLDCDDTNITELPPLPDGLLELICDSTNITQLPPLPRGLTRLECGGRILKIPPLPESLVELYCQNTNIIDLPPLPVGLERIIVQNTWVEHPTNTVLAENLTILIKTQRKLRKKLDRKKFLHRLSNRYLLKKIFSPQITAIILSY